jgi:hypothetical protein
MMPDLTGTVAIAAGIAAASISVTIAADNLRIAILLSVDSVSTDGANRVPAVPAAADWLRACRLQSRACVQSGEFSRGITGCYEFAFLTVFLTLNTVFIFTALLSQSEIVARYAFVFQSAPCNVHL